MYFPILASLLAFAPLASAVAGAAVIDPPPWFEHTLVAHGVLMSVAWIFMFPLGAMMIRLLKGNNVVWLHAGWMMTAYVIVLAAFGMGVWCAYQVDKLDYTHIIIGFTVVGAMILQPFSGLIHHALFKRRGTSNVATYLHLWWGRAVLTLAIINGGLGLQLAAMYYDNKKSMIAYGAIGGFMWVTWVIVNIASYSARPSKRGAVTPSERKESQGSTEVMRYVESAGDNSVSGSAEKNMEAGFTKDEE